VLLVAFSFQPTVAAKPPKLQITCTAVIIIPPRTKNQKTKKPKRQKREEKRRKQSQVKSPRFTSPTIGLSDYQIITIFDFRIYGFIDCRLSIVECR
jgi:hypothetical protein